MAGVGHPTSLPIGEEGEAVSFISGLAAMGPDQQRLVPVTFNGARRR
ncbi:hypothetical protein [Streptomyces sp. IMTB 2501]|nr:hypothetical protein [Streptomyces sp. IMTB 2501]